MTTLPNTEQLRTSLESLADCDSIAGPILQVVGVVFAAQAVTAQAQKEITRFTKDIESTRQKFNDDDFRKKFSAEIQNLNTFDEAFKQAMETDLSSISSRPFDQSMLSPDSLMTQNVGGFGMFPSSGLEVNDISKFSSPGMKATSPGGTCNSQGVGSFGSVQFPELSRTSERFRKASSSLAGIGMTLANDPTRALDLIMIPASKLAKAFLVRKTLLEDIEKSVSLIENLLLKLNDEEYKLRFDEVIADSKVHVDKSIQLLNAIIDDLAASGAFKQDEKNELKAELQAAADELSIPSGFPRSTGFLIFTQVQGMLITIDQQLRILNTLGDTTFGTLTNLSSFTTELTGNFKLANHFGGMFSVIRCNLKDISSQMGQAQRSGNVLNMISLIPKWRIQILMHKQMVEVAAQDPIPPIMANLDTSFGTGIKAVEEAAAEAAEFINQDSSEDVITKVRNFMSTAQTRLKVKIPDATVESRAQIARDALTAAISAQSSIQDVLTQFIGDSPEEQARAEALYSVIEAAPYLYAAANAIATGSWQQLFSMDSLESSAKALLGKYLAAASECCDAGNPIGADAIRQEAVRQVQESRLEETSRKYVYDVASRMQGLGITEITLMKSRLKRIQALLQLPCFGGSIPSRDVFVP